ncbi:unnamed protein product [Prunus brigantina]
MLTILGLSTLHQLDVITVAHTKKAILGSSRKVELPSDLLDIRSFGLFPYVINIFVVLNIYLYWM